MEEEELRHEEEGSDERREELIEVSSKVGTVTVECDSVKFTLGEKFSSYEQLEEKIILYEERNNVQLSYNDSRTLNGASKRAPKRVQTANKKLHYYYLHLTCNFGGKQFKSKGSGQRPCHRCVYST